MTITGVVVETEIENEVYVDENEDAEDTTDSAGAQPGFNDGEEVADGKHVVPNGVAIEVSTSLGNSTESGSVE